MLRSWVTATAGRPRQAGRRPACWLARKAPRRSHLYRQGPIGARRRRARRSPRRADHRVLARRRDARPLRAAGAVGAAGAAGPARDRRRGGRLRQPWTRLPGCPTRPKRPPRPNDLLDPVGGIGSSCRPITMTSASASGSKRSSKAPSERPAPGPPVGPASSRRGRRSRWTRVLTGIRHYAGRTPASCATDARRA